MNLVKIIPSRDFFTHKYPRAIGISHDGVRWDPGAPILAYHLIPIPGCNRRCYTRQPWRRKNSHGKKHLNQALHNDKRPGGVGRMLGQLSFGGHVVMLMPKIS